MTKSVVVVKKLHKLIQPKFDIQGKNCSEVGKDWKRYWTMEN